MTKVERQWTKSMGTQYIYRRFKLYEIGWNYKHIITIVLFAISLGRKISTTTFQTWMLIHENKNCIKLRRLPCSIVFRTHKNALASLVIVRQILLKTTIMYAITYICKTTFYVISRLYQYLKYNGPWYRYVFVMKYIVMQKSTKTDMNSEL